MPVLNLVEETADTALTPSDDFPLANLHVLVVDDEPDSRVLVAFVLESAGATAVAVDAAIVALQTLQATHFDILLSDIGMPEMDGYALIRQVRQSLAGEHILAIALTAYVGEGDQQQAIAAGFQTHLSKPVEPADLVATVARVCWRKG